MLYECVLVFRSSVFVDIQRFFLVTKKKYSASTTRSVTATWASKLQKDVDATLMAKCNIIILYQRLVKSTYQFRCQN